MDGFGVRYRDHVWHECTWNIPPIRRRLGGRLFGRLHLDLALSNLRRVSDEKVKAILSQLTSDKRVDAERFLKDWDYISDRGNPADEVTRLEAFTAYLDVGEG